MNSSSDGFLVVLSDVKAADDRDYLSWLTTEHVEERLGIPGFLAVRIFRKPIGGGHRYFIWYRLDSPDIVDSAAYVARLNNPTPWSQRIMPILENFGRGGGRVAGSVGGEAGSLIFAVGLSEIPGGAHETLVAVKAGTEIRSAHLLVTDTQKSAVLTNERALRTSDNSFAGLLIAESESESALRRAIATPDREHLASGLYREVFALSN